jgi:5-methylcytosine-specific restriction endonuclease McrA
MTRDQYRAYILSDAWKAQRDRLMAGKPRECVKCHKSIMETALDVHHMNYRNIHDVTPADVVYLCRPCHEAAESAKTNGNLRTPHTLAQLRAAITVKRQPNKAPKPYPGWVPSLYSIPRRKRRRYM